MTKWISNNRMKTSRVILVVLATLVIFAAGVVTGSLITRKNVRPPMMGQPLWGRFEMVRRAVEELDRRGQLSGEQRQRIDVILRNHQDLIADYFSILEPDVQDVFQKLRESVRQELSPEQRRQFEELSRRRLARPPNRDQRPEDFRRGPMPPGEGGFRRGPGPDGGPGPLPPPAGRRPPSPDDPSPGR
jgi:uncharacterized membrane protein